MRVVGPNCMGVLNTDPEIKMDATFAPTLPLEGNIGLFSHSGALAAAILDHARDIMVGFSKFASLGNRMDVSGNDLLAMFENDPQTDVILMYIESFGNPRNFTKIVKKLTKKKPVIALKSGRTEAGSRAALSHTGALAGLDSATDALFEQCGVIRVQSIQELFDLGSAFSMQPLPKGNRVAILTNAGGPGIMAVDACVSYGLEVANFSEDTKQQLKECLVCEASISNPIDMTANAGPEQYKESLEILMRDDNVDVLIVIFVPPVQVNELEVAKAIVSVWKEHRLPTVTCFLGRDENSPGFLELVNSKIPSYVFPENAAKTLAAMCRYGMYKKRETGDLKTFEVEKEKAEGIIRKVKEEGRKRLWDHEVFELLHAYGLPMARTERANDLEDLVKSAGSIGYPVALKILSRDVVHKTDVGGVVLNIQNEIELRGQYSILFEKMKKLGHQLEGVVVQEMVAKGKEVILGMHLDPKFGPILMFGLGGVYAEVVKDVSFRLIPLTDLDALRMIKSIKSYPLLEGVRGEKPSDLDSVSECLQRMAQLVADFYCIKEMDINPLIVFEKGQGSMIADARVILE
jgi:acetyltransferase